MLRRRYFAEAQTFRETKRRQEKDEAIWASGNPARSIYGHLEKIEEASLESTLFWIGCGLGAYGVVLRQIFKQDHWIQKRAVPVFLHLLFMAGVGALVGFVFSASTDL